MIETFWLTPTDLVQVWLRRFTFQRDHRCPATDGWGCDGRVVIFDRAPFDEWKTTQPDGTELVHVEIPDADPRWPTRCQQCGELLPENALRQVWADVLYSGAPDGELYTLRDAPVGAMWNAWWHLETPAWRGSDGLSLMVKTPGGDWHVDGRASNCTLPKDDGHKCWVRHGDPRTEPVTVDKRGRTCAAGAGSIQAGSYHGFLRDGKLT